MDSDFYKLQYDVVNLIDYNDPNALREEQETLGEHDDRVAELSDHIEQFKLEPDAVSTKAPGTDTSRQLAK